MCELSVPVYGISPVHLAVQREHSLVFREMVLYNFDACRIYGKAGKLKLMNWLLTIPPPAIAVTVCWFTGKGRSYPSKVALAVLLSQRRAGWNACSWFEIGRAHV